jgi:hypothetical protein
LQIRHRRFDSDRSLFLFFRAEPCPGAVERLSSRLGVGQRFGTVWLPVWSGGVLEAPISEPTGGTTLVPRYNNPG